MVLMLLCLLFALFVKYYTNKFVFTTPEYQFNSVKKAAIRSMVIIAVVIIISVVYILIVDKFLRYLSGLDILLLQSSFYFLITAIVILYVLYKKESFQSIGISKLNMIKSCILGIILGVGFYIFYQLLSKTNKAVDIISTASLLSLINFIFIGFSEEIIFRGFLQIRLIAWLGTKKGSVITAIIFSFFHLPVNLVFKGMDLQEAFFQCVNLIPLSLLFSYIMIKTKNITSVTILHTLIDWTIN